MGKLFNYYDNDNTMDIEGNFNGKKLWLIHNKNIFGVLQIYSHFRAKDFTVIELYIRTIIKHMYVNKATYVNKLK